MKLPLSDLKVGLRVRLEKDLPDRLYTFTGIVTERNGGLYVWNNDTGYLINEKLYPIWDRIIQA